MAGVMVCLETISRLPVDTAFSQQHMLDVQSRLFAAENRYEPQERRVTSFSVSQ